MKSSFIFFKVTPTVAEFHISNYTACEYACLLSSCFGPRSFFILTPAIAESVAAAVAIVEDLGTVVNPCVFSFCCSN